MRWLNIAGVTLITIALVLVLVLGAGYIGLALYDWNKLKPMIADALEDATGREVTIRGDVTMELDLSPAIAVNDITVRNAEWGSGPNMMTIPRAELEIALLSLLDERTEIERVLIQKPEIILETGESGKWNLQPVTQPEQTDQPDKPPGYFVRLVRIEEGDFTFRDQAMDRTFQGGLKILEARADAFDRPVRVDAWGNYSGRDFSIKGNIGSQAGMLMKENEWRVDLKAALGEARAKIDGIIPVSPMAETGRLKVSVEGENLSRLMAMFGISVPNDGAFEVTGNMGSGSDAERWRVSGAGRLGEMNFKLDGSLPELTSLEGLTAELSAEGPNYSNFMALFEVETAVQSAFDLTGDVSYPASGGRVKGKMDGTIGEMALNIDGNMPGITEIEGLESAISVKGPDLSKFLALFKVSMPMEKAFDISTDFNYPDAMTFHLDELRARIGDSDFTGTIRVDAATKPFAVAIDGTSDRLNLAAYLDRHAEVEPTDAEGEPTVVEEEPEAGGQNGQVFPDRSLPLEFLDMMNAEVDLKAESLLLPYFSLKNFQTETTLQDGHLHISTLQSNIGGAGTITGRMEIRPDADPPIVTAALDADGVQLNEMIRGGNPIQKLQGNMDLSLDLSGRGATYAELAADLTGKAGLNLSEGTLHFQSLRLLGYNILSALLDVLNPFDEDREFVDVNCMVIRFAIEDGLAESTALILDTPEVAIIGDGKINLKTEEINIPLNTIPKKNIGIKNVVGLNLSLSKFIDPLQIDGTLSNPTVRLDVPSALFSIGKAIGGVALFGPAGLAATLLSGGIGEQNRCQAALEKADSSDKKELSENNNIPTEDDAVSGKGTLVDLKKLEVKNKSFP